MLGLYREEMDHPGTDNDRLAELSVLKKRQLGEEVGTVRRLVWVGESYRDYAYTADQHQADARVWCRRGDSLTALPG